MKLVRSELRLDVSSVQTSSPGMLLRTCGGNHGNINSRLPLGVLSTNTLHRSSGGVVTSLRLKTCPGGVLQLVCSPPDSENETASEDGDAPLDIWAVIKPGHVREKIAIFASEEGRAEEAGGGGGAATPPCTGHALAAGPLRAAKAKGSWEENCSAKRRRRSVSNRNLRQDPRTPEGADHAHKPTVRQEKGGATEEEDPKVSVGDMVAFLERIAGRRQPGAKITLQRSSASITLARAPPPDPREGSEVKGEEPDAVRVSDMVARLESECLRRRAGGDLSRSSSLRRTVGRVLLAATDTPTSPSVTSSPRSESEMPGTEATPPSGAEISEAREVETQVTPPQSEGAEPPPGLLFLSPPSMDSKPLPLPHRTTFDPQPAPLLPPPSEQGRRCQEEAEVASSWRRASPDFLRVRRRLQQLLEPTPPFLSLLPLHLLLHILQLLNTRSLAALQCSCRYLHSVIQTYGVRPADSLWVSDPRYRDDPCKQCKRRYARGDVSLCRWHHKPYCQALPYGPGYWMCCHGARRDVPGCNVGLHDNRWVPAFHSINVPVYRRRSEEDT